MYKAKLKHIGKVDAGGMVEIWFEVYIDDELIYPYITGRCIPTQIENLMNEKMKRLKATIEELALVQTDLEVNMEI